MSGSLPVTAGLQLKVVTIATNETDGFQRFMRSAEMFDIDVEVGGAFSLAPPPVTCDVCDVRLWGWECHGEEEML